MTRATTTTAARSRIDYREFLRRLPKAELHVHLVGAMRPATLAELARRRGLTLPRPQHELYRYRNFYDFIEVFRMAAQVLVEADDFARVVHEYAQDASRSVNLRHIELFFDPAYHYPHGVSYRTQIDGLLEGLRAAKADFGVSGLLIPSIDRGMGLDAAHEVLDDVLAYRPDEVVGIGLDGPEDQGPPALFAPVFKRAGRAGFKRTAHVCEDYAPTPASNYAVCRDELGCERLDHGYRMLPDTAIVARARDDGITFTCCPKPSTRERDAQRVSTIARMADAGIDITLATDDPQMFQTDLADCYERVCIALGWGPDRARRVALAGVEASWLDSHAKAQLRRACEAEIDALTVRLDPATVPLA